MNNWSIAKRIIAGGILLLALLLTVSGIAIFSLSELKTFASTRLRDDAIPGMVYAGRITVASLGNYTHVLEATAASNAAERNQLIAKTAEDTAKITVAFQSYEDVITQEEDRAHFAELKLNRAAYVTARKNYFTLLEDEKVTEAALYLHEKVQPAFAVYQVKLAVVLQYNQDIALQTATTMASIASRATITASVIAGVSVLLGIGLGGVIIRGTNRSLREMAQVLDDASSQVAAAAGQVSGSSQSLAEGSSEQAASLEETSSSLEELSSMTKRNADSASSAKSLSSETRRAADAGNNDMHEMRQAMDAIKTSSNDIAKIIKTIDEIAFQTNILALNAAVEAARAGEAGAGFAVVADEVRALAQRSANSAKETASKIEIAIQNGNHGAQISGKVAQSLDVIVDKARKVDELIAEIATASHEQNHGIGQINTAVSQMDQITQSNAANAEETAAASEELSAQAITLKDAVGQLRQLVGGGQHAVIESYTPARSTLTPPVLIKRPPLKKPGVPSRSSASAVSPSQPDDFFQDT